jgi:hypothetical protein
MDESVTCREVHVAAWLIQVRYLFIGGWCKESIIIPCYFRNTCNR